MQEFLKKIKNPHLKEIINSVPFGDKEEFSRILNRFSEYDPELLWLLAYSREDMPKNRLYIEEAYKKFQKVLDKNFPKLLAGKGNFVSRMWELILCDALSASGEFEPKGAKGADFAMISHTGQNIQIEVVAPSESNDVNKRAVRPDYSKSNIAELSGEIHEIERPIVLRTLQAISDKKEDYNKDQPLIIAINSSMAVGLVSDDAYILRRILFGLGNRILNRAGEWGFEQLTHYSKPGEPPFPVAYFTRPEFSHISGIIYSSQHPLGFIPGGWGWHNSGITFVPNPIATNPASIELPFFKKILCDKLSYQEIGANETFKSVVLSEPSI